MNELEKLTMRVGEILRETSRLNDFIYQQENEHKAKKDALECEWKLLNEAFSHSKKKIGNEKAEVIKKIRILEDKLKQTNDDKNK